MQRVGWFKSLWNRMFGRPEHSTQHDKEAVIPPQDTKKKPMFSFDFRKYQIDNYGYGFISALATQFGGPEKKLVRINRQESRVHYVHIGHIRAAHRRRKHRCKRTHDLRVMTRNDRVAREEARIKQMKLDRLTGMVWA